MLGCLWSDFSSEKLVNKQGEGKRAKILCLRSKLQSLKAVSCKLAPAVTAWTGTEEAKPTRLVPSLLKTLLHGGTSYHRHLCPVETGASIQPGCRVSPFRSQERVRALRNRARKSVFSSLLLDPSKPEMQEFVAFIPRLTRSGCCRRWRGLAAVNCM